jgi:hypothetical protein
LMPHVGHALVVPRPGCTVLTIHSWQNECRHSIYGWISGKRDGGESWNVRRSGRI